MTVLFKADLQNTLTPEVGTFDGTSNKSGSFGLDNNEYYLQNTSYTKGYYYYYLKSGSDNSKLDITFKLAITNSSAPYGWNILFTGSSGWWGIYVRGSQLYLETAAGSESLGSYNTNTWFNVRITQEISLNALKIKVFIDDIQKADESRNTFYALEKFYLLGNSTDSYSSSGTILKNILITDGEEEPASTGEHKYLDYTGLQTLVTDIINYHTAHTVDAYSKTEIDNMLLNYYRNDGFGISSFGLSYFGGRR
jgi:hypothetical protein